jgi:Vacuolar protein 14 C-terminal Fig4p binding
VSVLEYNEKRAGEDGLEHENSSADLPMAFSLAKFVPLLQERIHVINPFTRTFLVSWLTLLDTIPDLELVYYLPDFLGGLFRFLSDPNRDVYVATQGLLERFLNEIKKIAKIKRGIEERRRGRNNERAKESPESLSGSGPTGDSASLDNAIEDSDSETARDRNDQEGDWIPGQDVQIDYSRILETLLQFVDTTTRPNNEAPRSDGVSREKEQEIGIVALRWIDSFFEISPEDILQFVPPLLTQVLPALSANSDQVRTTASRVNRSLMDYIVTFQDDTTSDGKLMPPPSNLPLSHTKAADLPDRRASAPNIRPLSTSTESLEQTKNQMKESTSRNSNTASPPPKADLDYAAAVNALTLQFLNEHEATRVAALGWLIMLHRKAPRKVLAFNDGTFPALLKTLSDPAEAVVTRDLQLLSQISRNSEDGYFTSFMVNLLQLFSTDRKLLEIRGNLIIRQLCMNLVPERIYRTLAECLEKDEDIEFTSIMVQNLNNNLITAPELADLRKRLRNLDSREGQMFFVALFKSWCQNAVATFSLCLLAQAYEQAYHLLQIFAELEMTVNMLIQIDKLVQLLESPVFTCSSRSKPLFSSLQWRTYFQLTNYPSSADLRLQLLEPDRYPYLYKCLYGLLMLLPQSSAFAALKNRLNSVSAIGLLHTPPAFSYGARSSYVTFPSSSFFPLLSNH